MSFLESFQCYIWMTSFEKCAIDGLKWSEKEDNFYENMSKNRLKSKSATLSLKPASRPLKTYT